MVNIAYFIVFIKKIGFFVEYLFFNSDLIYEERMEINIKNELKKSELSIIELKASIYSIKDQKSLFKLTQLPNISTYDSTKTGNSIHTVYNSSQNKLDSNKSKCSNLIDQFRSDSNQSQISLDPKRSDSVFMQCQSCVICTVDASNAFFLECGHSGICMKCGVIILKSNGCCYLCRASTLCLIELGDQLFENVYKVVTATCRRGNDEKTVANIISRSQQNL